jgi:hypothetical protein
MAANTMEVTMKSYEANKPARYGLYLSTRPMDIRFVGADGEDLDGVSGASYRRMPTWAVIAAGPVLGGAFVLAFPLLVILASIACIARLVATRVKSAAGEHAHLAMPRWEPSTAYLNKGKGDKAERKGEGDELIDLEERVAKKRADESDTDEQC